MWDICPHHCSITTESHMVITSIALPAFLCHSYILIPLYIQVSTDTFVHNNIVPIHHILFNTVQAGFSAASRAMRELELVLCSSRLTGEPLGVHAAVMRVHEGTRMWVGKVRGP